MIMEKKHAIIFGGIIALIILSGAGYYIYTYHNPFTDYTEEVHVHADFGIVVNDKKVDLTLDKYQSTKSHILHKHVHLHENKGDVIHRHSDDITMDVFLKSIGFTLTDTCLTNDTGERFCTDDTHELVLFVNKKSVKNPTSYLTEEDDKILLYYGNKNNPSLEEYFSGITNNSCLYSGTCPERGIAPPESCGLTCEI